MTHAGSRSRSHAELCGGLPEASALDPLPVTSKPVLMARFDDWVTDPAVPWAGVEAFLADLDNLGHDYLGADQAPTVGAATTGHNASMTPIMPLSSWSRMWQ